MNDPSIDLLSNALIVLAYLSLALELWLIPVPSVASAPSLVRASRDSTGEGGRRFAVARIYVPVLINIGVFLIPLVDAVSGLIGHPLRGSSGFGLAWFSLGAGLVICGRLLTIKSALDLRAPAELPLAQGTLQASLATGGIFAFSRNPGLLGMYAFALGLLLLKPGFWFALGLLHYVWHMHRRVVLEERSLSAQFGASYAAYRERTRRYV